VGARDADYDAFYVRAAADVHECAGRNRSGRMRDRSPWAVGRAGTRIVSVRRDDKDRALGLGEDDVDRTRIRVCDHCRCIQSEADRPDRRPPACGGPGQRLRLTASREV
jgi:hypothetical protein